MHGGLSSLSTCQDFGERDCVLPAVPSVPLPQPAPLEVNSSHLEHGVSEEGLQCALLAVWLGLILLEKLVKVPVLLAVCKDLEAVLVVADELLVDVQHWQQDVEQIRCRGSGVSRPEGEIAPGLWPIGPPREAVCKVQIPPQQRDPILGVTLIYNPSEWVGSGLRLRVVGCLVVGLTGEA